MQPEILRDLSVLWSLFHILILFMLLYRSRYSRRKTFFLTSICMLPVIIFNIVGLVFLGTQTMGKLFLLTATLPSLVFFYLISKDQRWRFLFTFCLSDTVAYWVIIVTNLLDYYIGGGSYILMFIGRLVLFPVIEWYAVRYLRKPYLEVQESVSKGWGIFAVLAALYYLLLAIMANYPRIITERPGELTSLILILFLMPLTYGTIFVSLYRQLLLHRKQQSDRILQEQRLWLEVQLEDQQHIKKVKHDMKAHIVTLSGLLAANKSIEAQEYLKGIGQDVNVFQKRFCENPYLNSVLNHYYQRFQKLNVLLDLDIQIGGELLPYMELCQILSNGLENAWEASWELTEDKREVSVQMRYNRSYLIIRIKNRCQESLFVEKGILPNTSKTGSDHGFGLKTIQDAACRLHGEIFCYTAEKYFILDVMVKVNK